MFAFPSPAPRRRPLIAAGVAALAFTTAARAAHLPGTYADKGLRVADAPASERDDASLHGLLSLRFDPLLAGPDVAETAQIELVETDTRLEARICDAAGVERWRGRWTLGRDFTREGRKIILHLRGEGFGDDRFVLVLERLDDRPLLHVTAARVSPSSFGPAGRSIGTYLFHLLP